MVIEELLLLQRYPGLEKKLKDKIQKSYEFSTSLDPKLISSPSTNWKSVDVHFPLVTEEMFKRYVSVKLQGNSGQQEKGYRMLQSPKTATVKIIRDNNNVFAKAMIKSPMDTSSDL